MKNKMSVLIAGLLLALVVTGAIGATNAYAQSQASGLLHGGGPGGRGLGLEGLQIAADALNMTTDELINALRSGKTLEQEHISQTMQRSAWLSNGLLSGVRSTIDCPKTASRGPWRRSFAGWLCRVAAGHSNLSLRPRIRSVSNWILAIGVVA